ncbi:MAG: type II secretion system F family protein [Opitutaceae bacterium]|nr:type II secretion system F family protein [Verrucomicrobiales bacterium]
MIVDLLILFTKLLLILGFAFGPLVLVFYALYFLATLPFRRLERARFLLDLLEHGIKRGQSPEQTVVGLAQSRDRSLGARVHLLAAQIERGLRLGQALDKVPRLLPPALVAMLKAGEEIGDVGKVLPACRRVAGDAQSQLRGAFNYLLVVVLVMLPMVPAIYHVLSVFVIPKYLMIFGDLAGGDLLVGNTGAMMQLSGRIIAVQVVLTGLLYLLVLLYVGGPRLTAWLRWIPGNLGARIPWLLPWRRKRLLRDFSGLLAVLLDAGLPEQKALLLAAQGTGNEIFHRKAQTAVRALQSGLKLTEAIQRMDDSGEFHWRLTNAAHGPGGFRLALNGWIEALDAKAFQQEQAASQLITTGLVIMNGVSVGVLGVALISPIYEMIAIMTLW